MYYRRKLVLAVLEQNGNSSTKEELHQSLFSISRKQKSPAYDFVPVHGKCYSFQLQHDLEMLTRERKLHVDGDTYSNLTEESFRTSLKSSDQTILVDLATEDAFHCETYPETGELPTLFTLGYEGLSLENYLRKLLENRITVLCDVRKNAYSMKFGFSKHQLQPACEMVGIRYEHIPELGIESELRKDGTDSDKAVLFKHYAEHTLPENMEAVKRVIQLLRSDERVTLTCFEANQCDCHRGSLSRLIEKLSAGVYSPAHL